MLDVGYEELVSVDVLADSEQLISVHVHVGKLFTVMGQEIAVSEDELEAVVEETTFVEGEDEPGECFVSGFDVLKLAVDI